LEVKGGTTQPCPGKAKFLKKREVSNIIPLLWEDTCHFLVSVYTHKPRRKTPTEQFHSVNPLQIQAPLTDAGGVTEGLRTKELLYNAATLVPMREAHILETEQDRSDFDLQL
jgi:hypothetical protein